MSGWYACFCEVDHDCAPVSQWCGPCREREVFVDAAETETEEAQ